MESSLFESKWTDILSYVHNMVRHLESGGADATFNAHENQMEAITLVYNLCTSTELHEKLGGAENNVSPETVKNELVDKFEVCLNEYHESVTGKCDGLEGVGLLRAFLDRWAQHKSVSRWLEQMFAYTERDTFGRNGLSYNEPHRPLDSIAVDSFRFIVYDRCAERIRTALLALIDKERRGEVIDSGLVGPCLGILVNLGPNEDKLQVYRDDFETFFLTATQEFYSVEGREWIEQDACTTYLVKAERRLNEEEGRVGNYLNPETRTELLRVVENALLGEQEGRLISMENSGMVAMLQRGRDGFDDLGRMYRLFNRLDLSHGASKRSAPGGPGALGVGSLGGTFASSSAGGSNGGSGSGGRAGGASDAAIGLPPLVELFREHVKREGIELHEREERSTDKATLGGYVSQLLALHDRYYEYLQTCFASHPSFGKALKDAFEAFMNKPLHGAGSRPEGEKPLHPRTSPAELLATYADKLMRGGKERESEGIVGDEALESAMDRLVKLFGYVTEKDMFQEFYRKLLGKRLLMNRFESEDLERAMIGKLKFQYGAAFTSKLEGMINDKNMNRETQRMFEEYVRDKVGGGALPGGLSMEVQVLQTGHWPSYPMDGLKLPPALQRGVEVYRMYYQSRTSQRRLQWIHGLSNVVMVAKLGPEASPTAYTATMSLHVGCVLLLFNEREELSPAQIGDALGLGFEEVKLAVASVAFGKQQILVKTGGSEKDRKKKSVGRDDLFAVNPKFKYMRTRFTITNAQAKMSEEEVQSTAAAVETDRRYMIDAAVVRVMKSSRVVTHQELIGSVIEQLRKYFNPKVPAIKQRIEDLINREYLKRSENDSAKYEYVA